MAEQECGNGRSRITDKQGKDMILTLDENESAVEGRDAIMQNEDELQ
jgi:hypothetical protein